MPFSEMCELIIESKQDKLTEFLETRKAGAQKIETTSRVKGGPSLLTAAHFKAKAKPYSEAIGHVLPDKPLTHCKQRALECLQKLKGIDNLTQNEWQKLTGELEAYGEAYIQSKK